MGSTQSLFTKLYKKRPDKQILLTDAELQQLNNIISSFRSKDAINISFEEMKAYLLPFMNISIIERLYDAMQWKPLAKRSQPRLERPTISPITFIYVISNFLKGNSNQKATIIRFMVGARDLGFVTSLDLFSFVKDLLINHLQIVKKQNLGIEVATIADDTSYDNLALNLLHDLFDPKGTGKKLPTLTQYSDIDVAGLLESTPILLYMLHQVLYPPFPIYLAAWQFQSFLPNFITLDDVDSKVYPTTMLDIPSLIFLNMHIPRQVNKSHEWMLVFSSFDGDDSDEFTFEELISRCLRYDNTLFIIEDSDLYRFGGFSSDKWIVYPKFRGSLGCFVFSLVPQMTHYKPTGINKNCIYMNDFTYEESPQFIGFGGSQKYPAFSINSDCKTGVSYPTLTYNSPQLSSKTNFQIGKLEIWAIFRASAMRTQGWKTQQISSVEFSKKK
uniref:MTOR-associated protein MEAK7 n=1 Tax=Strigamia maritima TaxID=126957 RepID=T1J4X0_STRMM